MFRVGVATISPVSPAMELCPEFDSARSNELQCLARRSVSIFSRRGTSSPKPKTSSICQALVESPKMFTATSMHESPRQLPWTRKTKTTREDRGTILHAVPSETAGHAMSPLEVAMATSPNEEILQAIGRSNTSTSSNRTPVGSGGNGSPGAISNTSPVQSSINSRIGVWRDGVALWDVMQHRRDFKDTTACSPTSVGRGLSLPADRTERPRLSVLIPNELRHAPKDRSPPPIRVAPAATTSKHRTPARRTSDDGQRSIHPAYRSVGEGQINDNSQPASLENNRSSISSNTIFQDDTFDETSRYSRCSSMTSVNNAEDLEDAIEHMHWNYMDIPKRSVSAAFSITSPVNAGVFDDTMGIHCDTHLDGDANSHAEEGTAVLLEKHASRSSGTLDDGSDWSNAHGSDITQPVSPTLSEAVQDLQTQLSAIQEEPCLADAGSEARTVTSAQTLSRAPTIPRRSRKREWKASADSNRNSLTHNQTNLPVRRQSAPYAMAKRINNTVSDELNDVRRVSSLRLPTSASTRAAFDQPSNSAEMGCSSSSSRPRAPRLVFSNTQLCLQIMAQSSTMEDLASMSAVNRMMRYSFQENEMMLLKHVLYNVSPPAWELREWSPLHFGDVTSTEALPSIEFTPSAYRACILDSQGIVHELKSLILTRCQSFLRPETLCALASDSDADTRRFDAAFYRIWCFCKIFGCEKGRENDLKGQIDWLRGGPLAHQIDCGATLDFKPEFDMDGILLNPPEHFARGNEGGLSAEQLYDMTEIWDCLATLMQGYEGRVVAAQNCGILPYTQQPLTENGAQENMLEEWIAYVLTLGPSTVLELSRFAPDSSDIGIEFASLNGWSDWTPPFSGTTRKDFLRNPVTQLYEEQLVASTVDGQEMEVGKRLLRKCQRQAIKVTRIPDGQWPLIDNKMIGQSVCGLSRRDSALAPEVCRSRRRFLTQSGSRSGDRMVYPATWSPRKVSPVIEERVETFNRMSMLGLDGLAENTSERAIAMIVDMGFTISQAKEALKLTDVGNGIRVDRAVDWLLKQY